MSEMEKTFSVRILERDFQNPLTLPPLALKPDLYSYTAIGGPKHAEIKLEGSEVRAFWEMLEFLRCPIEIYDDHESLVWWGYLSEVEFTIDAVVVRMSLDEMYNRIAVIYSDDDGKGVTSWIQDDDSISTYGTKELITRSTVEGLDFANLIAVGQLEALKKPAPDPELLSEPAELSGRLICKGWYSTLAWQYYGNIAGREFYEDTSSDTQDLGAGSSNQKVAESFVLESGSGWNAKSVRVRLRTEGSPTDNVTLSICSDNSGVPGTVLASKSVAASEIDSAFDWQSFEFASLLSLAASTTYWVVLERSGAADSSNYYKVNVNEEAGYSRGVLRIYGGSWATRSPDADLLFAVIGAAETTEQIAEIVSACGQFLTGTDIKQESNIATSQYRNGETSAEFELTELLIGGESSGQRLLATVNKNRELVVTKEPELNINDIGMFINSNGRVENIWNDPYYDRRCPVGIWAQLKDVIPGSLDLGILADPTIFFIEEAEYDVGKRRYMPTSKRVKSPYSVGTLLTEG